MNLKDKKKEKKITELNIVVMTYCERLKLLRGKIKKKKQRNTLRTEKDVLK